MYLLPVLLINLHACIFHLPPIFFIIDALHRKIGIFICLYFHHVCRENPAIEREPCFTRVNNLFQVALCWNTGYLVAFHTHTFLLFFSPLVLCLLLCLKSKDYRFSLTDTPVLHEKDLAYSSSWETQHSEVILGYY